MSSKWWGVILGPFFLLLVVAACYCGYHKRNRDRRHRMWKKKAIARIWTRHPNRPRYKKAGSQPHLFDERSAKRTPKTPVMKRNLTYEVKSGQPNNRAGANPGAGGE